jgi:hypothetical protein
MAQPGKTLRRIVSGRESCQTQTSGVARELECLRKEVRWLEDDNKQLRAAIGMYREAVREMRNRQLHLLPIAACGRALQADSD